MYFFNESAMTVSLPVDGNGAEAGNVVDAGTGSSSSSSSSSSGGGSGSSSGGSGNDVAVAATTTGGTAGSGNTAGSGIAGGSGGRSSDMMMMIMTAAEEEAFRKLVRNRRVLAARTDSLGNVMNNRLLWAARGRPPAVMAAKPPSSLMRARRALFGRPRDPVANRAWLHRRMSAQIAAAARAWNFDFAGERPMQGSPSDRYAWERVTVPQKRAADDAGQSRDSADSGGEQDGRAAAGGKKQKQSKVTDYMGKTKKIVVTVAAAAAAAKKDDDNEQPSETAAAAAAAANDERSSSRHSISSGMTAI